MGKVAEGRNAGKRKPRKITELYNRKNANLLKKKWGTVVIAKKVDAPRGGVSAGKFVRKLPERGSETATCGMPGMTQGSGQKKKTYRTIAKNLTFRSRQKHHPNPFRPTPSAKCGNCRKGVPGMWRQGTKTGGMWMSPLHPTGRGVENISFVWHGEHMSSKTGARKRKISKHLEEVTNHQEKHM